MDDETPPDPGRRALMAGVAMLAGAGALPARAEKPKPMKHVVLLGDSIFDNAAYVDGGPDVTTQVGAVLPAGWEVTLNARDGATITDIEGQLADLPDGTSHLVVSIGGNDALEHESYLAQSADSVAEVLGQLDTFRRDFQKDYAAMLDAVVATKLPATICTIYDANYEDPETLRIANTGLTIFNDMITREVFKRGLPLIDLRLIFNEPQDYANPVEPSSKGGAKLAQVIATVVTTHDFGMNHSEVYAG